MDNQVSSLRAKLIADLRTIHTIRPLLTQEACKKVVVSIFLSKLDYCNSLLFNTKQNNIRRLQSLQNSAARVIFGKKIDKTMQPHCWFNSIGFQWSWGSSTKLQLSSTTPCSTSRHHLIFQLLFRLMSQKDLSVLPKKIYYLFHPQNWRLVKDAFLFLDQKSGIVYPNPSGRPKNPQLSGSSWRHFCSGNFSRTCNNCFLYMQLELCDAPRASSMGIPRAL